MLVEILISLLLCGPWVDWFVREWLPQYRFRRTLDGTFLGDGEGGILWVVEPAVLEFRRRWWLARYQRLTVTWNAAYGHEGPVVALRAVRTCIRWFPGRALHNDLTLKARLEPQSEKTAPAARGRGKAYQGRLH
jgi:hypothetical protein